MMSARRFRENRQSAGDCILTVSIGCVLAAGALSALPGCEGAPAPETSAALDEGAGNAEAPLPIPAPIFGTPAVWSSYFCVDGEVCRAADVNGDGRADLVAFTHGATPQVFVGLSTGTGFLQAVKWSDYFCTSTETCEVADVNGDGKVDVIAFTRGPQPRAWVALSSGSGFGTPTVWSSYFCADGEVCRAADVNGDRRADLIAFSHGTAPRVWVGLSTGAAFLQAVKWSDYFCTSTETCEVADVNGGGRADVIAFTRGPQPRAWVALSSGSGFGTPTVWSSYFCTDGEVCRAADVDADGRADLIAFTHGTTPQVFVGLSTGAAFSQAVKWSDYFCTSTETCEVGDVDGDGRADVIAFTRGAMPRAWVSLGRPG